MSEFNCILTDFEKQTRVYFLQIYNYLQSRIVKVRYKIKFHEFVI